MNAYLIRGGRSTGDARPVTRLTRLSKPIYCYPVDLGSSPRTPGHISAEAPRVSRPVARVVVLVRVPWGSGFAGETLPERCLTFSGLCFLPGQPDGHDSSRKMGPGSPKRFRITKEGQRFRSILSGHAIRGHPLCPTSVHLECVAMALDLLEVDVQASCLDFEGLDIRAALGIGVKRAEVIPQRSDGRRDRWEHAITSRDGVKRALLCACLQRNLDYPLIFGASCDVSSVMGGAWVDEIDLVAGVSIVIDSVCGFKLGDSLARYGK